MMRLLTAVAIILQAVVGAHALSPSSQATVYYPKGITYYASPNGSDSNSGLSPDKALQTCGKLNGKTYYANDAVLLQGGQTLTTCAISLTYPQVRGPFTISTYGSGSATINSGTSSCISATNFPLLQIRDGIICSGAGIASTNVPGIVAINNQDGNTKIAGPRISNVEVSGYGGDGVLVYGGNGTSGFVDIRLTDIDSHDNTGVGPDSTACVHVWAPDGYGQGITNPAHSLVSLLRVKSHGCTGKAGGTNWTGSGTMVAEARAVRIEYGQAYGNGQNSDTTSGPCGIWTADAVEVLVQYNESHHNLTGNADGCGFDIDGGVKNAIYQYNYSHDNAGAGLEITAYNDGDITTFENNVYRFNISQNNGVEYTLNLSSTVTGCYFYNNTSYGSSRIIDQGGAGPADCNFSNNIFYYLNASGGDLMLIRSPDDLVFTGNSYFGNGDFNWDSNVYSTFAAWQTATGQEKISGSNVGHTVEPRLVVYGGGGTTNGYNPSALNMYQLQTGSPMIGAGINLLSQFGIDVGPVDYYGVAVTPSALPVGAGQQVTWAGASSASCSEATTLIGRMTTPTTAEQQQANALLCGLKADGVLPALDVFYKWAATSQTNALLNWISTSFNSSLTPTVTFSAGHGFTGDAVTGQIDSNFNPTTAVGHYSTNSAHVGVYITNSRTVNASGVQIVANDGTLATLLCVVCTFAGGGSTAYAYINENNFPGGFIVTPTDVQGLWVMNQTDATHAYFSQNVSVLVNGNFPSDGVPNIEFSFLGGSTDTAAYAFIGGGLSTSQNFFRNYRVNADAIALGINSW